MVRQDELYEEDIGSQGLNPFHSNQASLTANLVDSGPGQPWWGICLFDIGEHGHQDNELVLEGIGQPT